VLQWGLMKIKLVFDDWRNKTGCSVYGSDYELSLGNFHSGTTFPAEITLDAEDETELKESIKKGFVPVFYLVL
jgi:hypothetical protein